MKFVRTIQLFVSIRYRSMTLPYLGYHVPLEENQRRTAAQIVSKPLNLPKAIEVGPISVGLLTYLAFGLSAF